MDRAGSDGQAAAGGRVPARRCLWRLPRRSHTDELEAYRAMGEAAATDLLTAAASNVLPHSVSASHSS